jgi:hypothetical protein
MKDLRVTVSVELSTTAEDREEQIRHALSVLAHSLEENGADAFLDECTVEEL